MEIELRPCPFCGGEAGVIPRTTRTGSWYTICDKCGAGTIFYDTEAEAIAAWNRREPDAAPVRHGYWIPIADGDMAECSECGENLDPYDMYAGVTCFADFEKEYKFCPHCGAKMDGGGDDGVD